MTHRKGLLHTLTVVLTVVQCALWFFAGFAMWSIRDLVFLPASGQVEDNSVFALVILALALINLAAVLVYLVQPERWGGLEIAVVMGVNLLFSVIATLIQQNPGWLVLGGIPAAATLAIVLVSRRRNGRT